MSFWRGLAIGMILAWVCSSRAELVRIRVKVLNASEVSDEYLRSVIDNVSRIYRSDLRVRLRVRVSKSNHIDHQDFILIEDRFNEFIAYSKVLKKRPYWNRVTFVAIPPYYSEAGCSYGTGLSTWFAVGVIREIEHCSGADRFNSDWVTAAHEICHTIAYNRRRFGHKSQCDHKDKTPNVMHSAALMFTPTMDLKFLRSTRKQLNFNEVRG